MSAVNMPYSGQGVMPPAALQKLHEAAKTFVTSAEKVAKKILPQATPSTTSSTSQKRHVHVHHHCHNDYGWGYSPFWSRPTCIIAPYGSSRSQKDDNNSALRVFVGLISVAVGGVAFYAIGNTIKSFRKIERKLEENRSFTTELKDFKQINESSESTGDLVNKLERIASLRGNILQRKKQNNIFDLAAVVTLATSCTIAAVGAVMGAPGLMAAGTLLGLGVGAVALVKWGMDSDSKQKRDADALLKTVNALPQF